MLVKRRRSTDTRDAMPGPVARKRSARRAPLTRERILRSALELADTRGIEAVSMRRLGEVLHVEAMSLYRYVAGKEDVLDGLADLVASEFEVPAPGGDWRAEVRRSAISAHAALRRHPWAGSVLESRTDLGPARLRYLEAMLGALRAAGLDLRTVGWAIMALDSHTYGFALQEQAWAFDPDRSKDAAAAMAASLPADAYPNLQAMALYSASERDAMMVDFTFGLDLILDGLERLRGAGDAR
jgi:AcrR family transcriptional regulator